jgi:hypothetical protein
MLLLPPILIAIVVAGIGMLAALARRHGGAAPERIVHLVQPWFEKPRSSHP